ncbi:MAG: KpsF/GutQ family sugar-phosphate isomerase [Ignavibacteriae bacterium]|nr:KpsF/GutQ family sugar-phosphate isomerase [Ignavibacteriota bacterium]
MPLSEKEINSEVNKIFDLNINALQFAKHNITNEYAKAIELLSKSKKVIVSGVGKSGLIAKKIAATFSSIGFKSFFLHPVEALHGDIGLVEEGDCCILLSKSGTSEDIIRLIPYLKSRDVKIIAIVGNLNSYLAYNSDVILDGSVEKEACPFDITPTTSTMLSLVIGDILAVCSMLFNNITITDFAKNHPLGQIGKNITLQVKDVMHKNSSLPLIYDGSGFKEAIIEISNKKLGCVCIIDKSGKLLGIITDGDVRRILQIHEDIRNLKVEDVMTSNPISITQDLFLNEALSVMEQRESQINVLPVTDDEKKCIGVIRIHDIIRSGI